MSHELETINGKTSFFSHRQTPWHMLGTITDKALTLDEALEVGGLNWPVYKSDVEVNGSHLSEDGVATFSMPDKYATYRHHPELGYQGLGVVGKQYQVVQNREIAELVEAVVDQSGGIWETAGSLFNGRRVFMSIELPKSIQVGGEDKTGMYMVVGSSHDGTLAVTAMITAVRVVCQNTFTAALKGASSKYVFRHSGDASMKVQQAREALSLSFEYADEYEKAMEELLRQPMTEKRFKDDFVESLVPEAKTGSVLQAQRVWRVRDELRDLWDSPTQDFGRGTAYGALMAVTEFDQWVRPVKGQNKDVARSIRNLSGDMGKLSQKAIGLLVG